MKILSISLFCFSIFMLPAQAGTSSAGGKYTLEELVSMAISHTRLLASQDSRAEEKRLAASQARFWPGLSLDLSAGRRRQDSISGPRYDAALAQPLPLSGKPGLRGRLLDAESESWSVRRAASQAAVTLSVVQLAYEYALNRQKAAFVEKRQRRFELIQAYLAGRVFPTPQRRAESRIVQNRLKGLAADAIQSQARFSASLEKLKAYVPLEAGTYPSIEVPWFSGAKSLDREEWINSALENNPDLRIQRLTVKSAETEKTLASRDRLPEPAIVASYGEGRAADTEKNYGLGLRLSLPAWNSNRSGIRSAEQKRLAEEKLLDFEEQKLKSGILRALVEYEAARRVVLQYPRGLLSGLETQLQEADDGFRRGQVDLLTFLELDNSASDTYNRALNAHLDLYAAAAELLASAGEKDILGRLGSLQETAP